MHPNRTGPVRSKPLTPEQIEQRHAQDAADEASRLFGVVREIETDSACSTVEIDGSNYKISIELIR